MISILIFWLCFVILFLKLYVWVVFLGLCDFVKDCKNNVVCIGNVDGLVMCKCRREDECFKDGDGVCGLDGQLYINKCFLDVVVCVNNKEVDVCYIGVCGELLIELQFVDNDWCIVICLNFNFFYF